MVPGHGVAGASTEATALSAVPHLDDAHPLTHDAAGVLSAARITVGVRTIPRRLTRPAHLAYTRAEDLSG